VVFEATYGWSWFADLLADVGIPAHMAHPLATKAISAARVIQRFPSPERLCSWAGLTPGERTSDAHTRRGHITKQGSRWLRWMLVEAATTAVRDPQLGRFTAQIARRRGPKIARVALARRPLTPVLLRPARRRRLPCLPRPRTITGSVVRARSVCVMALLCNGRRLD
jgi:hypothetical protein